MSDMTSIDRLRAMVLGDKSTCLPDDAIMVELLGVHETKTHTGPRVSALIALFAELDALRQQLADTEARAQVLYNGAMSKAEELKAELSRLTAALEERERENARLKIRVRGLIRHIDEYGCGFESGGVFWRLLTGLRKAVTLPASPEESKNG